MTTVDFLPDAHVKDTLRWAGPARQNWVPPTPGVDNDVIVVGGGQNGVAIAYGLAKAGITNVRVIDQAGPGATGVWTTTARMNLLRTSKLLAGPTFGNPSLGFRAWYEKRHGSQAFDALARIPRLEWASYLAWYQQIAGIGVDHHVRLLAVEPVGGALRLTLDDNGRETQTTTRKLVLATGLLSAGGAEIPAALRALPRDRVAHTADAIDFSALKGRSVAVVGAGPSAFDAAAVALESGAADVHLFCRRSAVACVTPSTPTRAYPAAADHFVALPDRDRWRFQLRKQETGASVPADSVARATAFANFHIHLESALSPVTVSGRQVIAASGGETFAFDFIVAATGYRVDLAAVPELSSIAGGIALWGDKFRPDPGDENEEAARFPYLGSGFEFIAKAPGEAPHLSNIHCFTIAANVSFGKIVSDIPSMVDLPLLIDRISRDLFFADYAYHRDRFSQPQAYDVTGNLYRASLWRQPAIPAVAT